MKKNYLAMTAMAIGLLTFSACSSDDDFGGEQTTTAKGEMQDVELTFNIGVNSAKGTRGGRPLYSAEALQRVNDVDVYVFEKVGQTDEYKFVKEINKGGNFGFNNTDANYSGEKDETHSYTLTDKLASGTYKFLAIGYEKDHANTYDALTLSDTEGQETKLADVVLTLKGTHADEVFSGVSNDVTVGTENQSINVSIELSRVVAGVLGYFKNVPYELEHDGNMVQVKHVFVTAVKKGTSATLADRKAKGVASGETRYNIIDIVPTGSKSENGNWYAKAATAASDGTPATVADAFLSGQFSLPIAAVDGQYTLQVVLTGDNTSVALRTYNVKQGSETAFSLDANSIYMIGHKSTDDGTNGEDGNDDGDEDKDPNDPDKDDDPVDLSKEQILSITVKADWTGFYDLDIE